MPRKGLNCCPLLILWSFFGGLPFVFSGQIPSVIDAFFEISSGFTTTGATILNDVSVLTRSLLFWRSFTHLIGGMGVLVFALAIMDNAKNSHLEVMKAEVPGPVFGKVVSKLKNTAQILYLLYLALFSLFCGYLLSSRHASMIVLSSLWERQELGALPSITTELPTMVARSSPI